MDPNGRVVIITGASSGIGAAAARAFAAAGARVVLAARSADALQRVAQGLPGQPLVVPTDVGAAADVQALVDRVVTTYDCLDILINNAGVGLAGPVTRLAPSDLERALAVNVLGPLYAMQAAVPVMCRQGRGQIINVSSVVGVQTLPFIGGYAATKSALDRLTQALRIELLHTGVTVTLVRPGTTRTAFAASRLGSGHERRRFDSSGVPPEVVAGVLLRAARREPRVAYVTLADRMLIMFALLAPRLTERFLARSFTWDEPV